MVIERKLAEETIRSNRARYQAFMQQSSEAQSVVDIQSQEIVEVNRRFTELFGYSLPEDAPLYVNKVTMESGDVTVRRYTKTHATLLGVELDFRRRELRYVGAGISKFYFNGKIILTPGMFVGMWDNAEFEAGVLPIQEGDCIHFLTDGFTDALAQPENAGFKDFEADVAALDKLAESGGLRDDATGICLKIKGSRLPKVLGDSL